MKTTIAIIIVGVIVFFGLIVLGIVGADGARERAFEYDRQQIQLGRECADAGGQWVYNGFSGWLCEFRPAGS